MSSNVLEKANSKPTRKWSSSFNAFVRWSHIYVSMCGFLAMLFFSFTGITLNHPTWFGGESFKTTSVRGKIPVEWVRADFEARGSETDPASPTGQLRISEQLRENHRLRGKVTEFRVDEEECLVAYKGPGYSADVFLDRRTGGYDITIVEHGIIAKWNDLHKGRDSGIPWSVLIDVSAIVMIVSALTGVGMLFFLKRKRKSGFITAGVGAILFIIGAATAVAWSLTQSGFSRQLATLMTQLPGGAPMFIVVSIIAFIILGSVLEGIPAVVLFGPLVFPIAKSLGIHEVHYAMVVILSMGLGLFMPPVGVGYYAACAVGRVDPNDGLKSIWGYMLALLVGIFLVAAIPWLSIGFL